MFSKFKGKNRKIFLDKFTKIEVDNKDKIEIILSPSLYWVKKIDLDVSLREIKKLLPSIFEDVLPEGNYSYYVYKDDNNYIAFAYEDKKILSLLKEKKIPLSNISSIHFAQTELQNLSAPAKVNENDVVYVKDKIVLLGPKEWFENLRYLNLDYLILSNKKIKIKQYGDIIDTKHLYKINIALGLFILILITQIFIIDKKIDKINSQKDELFQKYHLKPTMMQNRSILESYKETFNKEVKLRKVIGKILKMRLAKNEKIMEISFNKNKVFVKINGIINDERASKIMEFLDKENFISSSKFRNNQLYIEVQI